MLTSALEFPRQNDDWLRNVLIGGAMLFLSFLVIPTVFVYGYLARVLRASSTGVSEAPDFDDWEGLFVEGLKQIGVVLAYLVVPLVLTVVVAAFVGALTMNLESGAGDAGVLGAVAFLVLVVLWLSVVYVLPAAMTNAAREQSFEAAFDLGALRTAALSADYVVALVLAVVVSVVLGAIASVLTVLIVGIFLSFYVQVVSFYLVGRGFGEATGTRRDDPGTAPDEADTAA